MKNETELQHEVDEAVRTLREGGLLIFEHSKQKSFEGHPHLLQTRSYGSVQFSFFGAEKARGE